MKKPYRIEIAEDYTILREGLRSLLSSNPDFDVAGEAEDGHNAIRSVQKFKLEFVLMDLSMLGWMPWMQSDKSRNRVPIQRSWS